LGTPSNFLSDLKSVLQNKELSKFGDSIVNFIYNAAIFEETQKSRGVKVWDSCLAQACRNTKLREYVGSKKNAGDLGDAVEAFIAYVYLRNKVIINEMISILSTHIHQDLSLLATQEKEVCKKAFTSLINFLCNKLGISN
jgi:dsRNA-specific ribonuclease